jgi:diguanylate cyclase (GGDEF)-like protein
MDAGSGRKGGSSSNKVVTEGLSRDARALKQTRARLRSIEYRLEAILASAGHGVTLYDRNQRLVYCNQTFLDVYRLPPALGRKGTSYRAILESRVKANTYIGDDPERFVEDRIRMARDARVNGGMRQLNSGQIVALTHLPIADGGWVSTHKDVTENMNMHAELSRLAFHDPLTGMANRTQFYRKLDGALTGLAAGRHFAVLCLDLDGFKPVNDAYGHAAGDALLRDFSGRLRRVVPANACAARMGGDEFAILAPAHDAGAALQLAERIIAAMDVPFDVDGRGVTLSVGIGIAVAPEHGDGGDALLGAADLALYATKRRQRGGVLVYSDGVDAEPHDGDELALELRRALEQGEFELYYQPIINLAAARLTGFEVLLRWQHPVRGMVLPEAFVPAAEACEMIVPIGEWMLRQAAAEAAGWPDDLRLAINVSPVQLRHREFPALVLNALAGSGVAPRRLEIEVSAPALVGDIERRKDMLGALRSLGVRVVLGGSGTGQSSLGDLLSLQFDRLKLERNLVAAIDNAPNALTIVRAFAALGRELGVETTADGIETMAQLRAVHDAGFSDVQGTLMARPMTAHAMREMLREAFDRMDETPLLSMQASG